jgi:hypothetical protein
MLANSASSKILAGDPQLPHHGIQRRPWHPERVAAALITPL